MNPDLGLRDRIPGQGSALLPLSQGTLAAPLRCQILLNTQSNGTWESAEAPFFALTAWGRDRIAKLNLHPNASSSFAPALLRKSNSLSFVALQMTLYVPVKTVGGRTETL